MAKILVTGGCGYIGSHTLVALLEKGYDVISVDNNSRSGDVLLKGVEQVTGKKVKNYKVDLCNYDDSFAIFQENRDINGIIHFAAYKSVSESVQNPLLYFENNLVSLMNLLKCVQEFQVPYFVFSSSCTVYGNPESVPVTENSPPRPAESPYGYSKQMSEQIVREFSKSSGTPSILLRYFNPVGAHPTAFIGEIPLGNPENLVPAITQTAIGKRPGMVVYGDDYPTRDGSCIRDYIHVCDIADAHALALAHLEKTSRFQPCQVFNLGSGTGVTVLEAIHAFEKVSGISLPFEIGPRRKGDVVAIYANNDLAKKELGWTPRFSLEEMMATAWKWELKRKHDEDLVTGQFPDLN